MRLIISRSVVRIHSPQLGFRTFDILVSSVDNCSVVEKSVGDLSPYANFFFEVGTLSRTPRSGFRHLGNWRQSVAEHLCRTAYIGFTIAHLELQKGVQVDIGGVVERCLFHDLGEARTGDLDYIGQKYARVNELRAVQDSVKNLPFGQRIIDAFTETEERSTPEGNVAKDADALELLCSLKEITDSGNPQAMSWTPSLLKRLRTRSAQELAEVILKTNSSDWCYGDRDDKYWIKGGG